MIILSEKQEQTQAYIEKCLNGLVKSGKTFRIAILGDTGIKYVINLIKKQFQKDVHFCELNLKINSPINLINEIRIHIEKDLNLKSEHVTEIGKFEAAVVEFNRRTNKKIVVVIRNFNDSSLKYSKEIQVLLDELEISVILGMDNYAYENLDHYDSSIKSRIGNRKVECGFFIDITRFKKFCEENKINFDKYHSKISGLTFNQLEQTGEL
jgi:hypothetical protein